MFEIIPLLDTSAVQRIGWALLHFLWQGAAIALLAGLGLHLLRRSTSQSRYAMLLIALAAMVIAPLVTLATVTPLEQNLPVVTASTGLRAERSAPLPGPLAFPPIRGIDRERSVVAQSEFTAAAGKEKKAVSLRDTLAERLMPVFPWIVAVWLLGVAVLSLRLLGAWWWLRRLLSRQVQPLAGQWEEMSRRLLTVVDVRRRVQFLESRLAQAPAVIGWMKPVVLVPTAVLTNLTVKEVEALLAHELAHIRRWDDVVNLLQAIVETILFYHPAVWWVSSRLRAEREHCCDDLAAGQIGDRLAYSRALLAAAELATMKSNQLVVASTGGELTRRVRRLLGVSTLGQPRSGWPIALIVAATVIVAIGLTLTTRTQGDDTEKKPKAEGVQKLIDAVEKTERSSPEVDKESVESAFAAIYHLNDGEVLRHIPEPFNQEVRLAYYRLLQFPDSILRPRNSPPTRLFVRSKDGHLEICGESVGEDSGQTVSNLVLMLLKIFPQEIQGDEKLLNLKIKGDWVYDADAPPDEILRDLGALLSREWNIPLVVESREVEQDCYVAHGEWKFSPLSPAKPQVEIYSNMVRTDGTGLRATGTFDEFLNWTGRFIRLPILNEVSGSPAESLTWHLNDPATSLTRKEIDEAHSAKSVLNHLTEQTGLTFTKDRRKVKILFVERDDRPTAQNSADRRSLPAASPRPGIVRRSAEEVSPIVPSTPAVDDQKTWPITVTGRAVDLQGKPVPGAKLYLASIWGEWKRLAETTCDPQGAFTFRDVPLPLDTGESGFRIPYGVFEIVGTASGYGIGWRPKVSVYPVATEQQKQSMRMTGPKFFGGESIELDVTFAPPAKVGGKIVDDLGHPMPDVVVSIWDIYLDPLASTWEQMGDINVSSQLSSLIGDKMVPADVKLRITDADGKFEFENLPQGCHFGAMVRPPGFPSRRIYLTTSDSQVDKRDEYPLLRNGLRLEFQRPEDIPLRVVYEDTGLPAAYVAVSGMRDGVSSTGVTNAQGLVTLRLPAGEYEIVIFPADGTPYLRTDVQQRLPSANGQSPSEVRLRRAGIVSVLVVDEEGNGIPDVDLWHGTVISGELRKDEYAYRTWTMPNVSNWVAPRTDASGHMQATFEPGEHRIGIGWNWFPRAKFVDLNTNGQTIQVVAGETTEVVFKVRKQ